MPNVGFKAFAPQGGGPVFEFPPEWAAPEGLGLWQDHVLASSDC